MAAQLSTNVIVLWNKNWNFYFSWNVSNQSVMASLAGNAASKTERWILADNILHGGLLSHDLNLIVSVVARVSFAI